MSTTDPTPASPGRDEEEDHDLLTYGEAGVRLHEEVRAQERVVAELEPAGGAALEGARDRLTLLREAVERNQRQPISDDNFAEFFGYHGTARRNT
jgi:hypothetical protein